MSLFGPPTITRLDAAKGMTKVYLGRKLAAHLPTAKAEAMGVGVGVPWTDDLATKASLAEEVTRAKRKAVSLLRVMSRSTMELRERLIKAGFAATAADEALEELLAARLLNDQLLAEAITTKSTSRGESSAATNHRLESRGLSPTDAPNAESRRALEAARNRLDTIPESLPAAKRAGRLLSALARLGYDEETAREAIAQLIPLPDES